MQKHLAGIENCGKSPIFPALPPDESPFLIGTPHRSGGTVGSYYALRQSIMLSKAGFSSRQRCSALASLLVGSLSAFVPSAALAVTTVSLAWTPSPDANVTGYKIYYGAASRDYTNSVAVGN